MSNARAQTRDMISDTQREVSHVANFSTTAAERAIAVTGVPPFARASLQANHLERTVIDEADAPHGDSDFRGFHDTMQTSG